MKFYQQINSKLLEGTVVFLLSLVEWEIFYAYEYENANISWHFPIYQQRKFHAQLSWAQKKFYNLGPNLTLLHSERPKLLRVLAILSAIGLKS